MTELTPWLDWIDDQHDRMLANTLALVNINSGSLNAQGVNAVADALTDLVKPLNARVERIPVDPYISIDQQGHAKKHPLGDALKITQRPDAPLKIFLCAHMDTVFPKDHPFQTHQYLDEHTINGPGAADLKGGIIVMLTALEALERSPFKDQIGWEILFNPDEEIGSPSSAALIKDAATRAHAGMIYEPCMPDGNLAGERKGSGNFTLVVRGKAAHAGREHHLGRNAIRAASDFICALDDLNGQREGVTINPGFVQGGGPVNIVPDLCIVKFNIRLTQETDEAWCQSHLSRLIENLNARDGIQAELHGAFGRKPKQLSAENETLFQWLQACGKEMGLSLQWLPTGGCCDGNNLAAAGVPNIDTLGVQGGKIHSDQEYMDIRSLTVRAKLSAHLLMRLATEPTDWLTQRTQQGDSSCCS